MKRYLTDWEAISACETRRDQDLAALRQQISDLEARAASEIARYRADQAEAAAVIRDHGGSEEDVVELFEISSKQARQLLAAARAHRDTTSSPPSASAAAIERPERDRPIPTQPGLRVPPLIVTDDTAKPPLLAAPPTDPGEHVT
ncbi:hypothetical protein [Nocardia abscessus]|uniref:hypothetical protein n=1 Tax=Nocardia abscessus TaxID=120957 RepID=UPI0024578F34|nr:hypothetical protein [Nocardia abscessus]